ncbi:Mitochondrial uncoupling protein 3 [Turnera subulata]|uniref:Mitochondrial uncoupling protein 3 n=1 Tax=Turnera subulata TaxID=218843 RepID=A0A9Q0G5T6_9ROSI|nr:Mitochondrial uncoupling protein 3 [Turnera subulata]
MDNRTPNRPTLPKTHTRILLTSLSAMVAETATFPIDLTKTRLQLQRQLHSSSSSPSAPPTNAFRVASEILRQQGTSGLYRGLSPAIIRHLFYTPIRVVGYENLRNFVVDDASASVSVPAKALLGGTSGVIAQQNVPCLKAILEKFSTRNSNSVLEKPYKFYILSDTFEWKVVASPADLVKVRMQADSRLVSQGLQPRYSGPFDALNKIICAEGIGGLWKGVFPNIQRAFLVNMGELACYDHAKHFVIRNKISADNIYAHTLASIISGLCSTALSCPADVVKTRMMNQGASNAGKVIYKSSYDCLVKTVRVEGLRALWKGFFPTWARLGPWQFVFWVSYEKFRQASGFSSF